MATAYLTVANKDSLKYSSDKMENTFSFVIVKLPMSNKNDINIYKRFNTVIEEATQVRNSYDVWVRHSRKL